MKILIGGPVYQRDWILGEWFDAIERQTIPLSDLGFIFELGPNDEPTHKVLTEWHAAHPEVQAFDMRVMPKIKHRSHPDGRRIWRARDGDYSRMSKLRNSILERVRCIRPERFFSLDSDILLEHPQTLEYLYELTKTKDAVSPLSYMFPVDKAYPNIMSWAGVPGLRACRIIGSYPKMSVFKADIIMAAVMMTPKVYDSVNYKDHPQGEDPGWSFECYKAGIELWSASNIYCPHIMHQYMLDDYRKIGDTRSINETFKMPS